MHKQSLMAIASITATAISVLSNIYHDFQVILFLGMIVFNMLE